MAFKTIKRVPTPNLKSFGPTKTKLRAKEVSEFSMRKWAGGVLLPTTIWLPQYERMEIFKTLNSRNFCIYWCIDLKLAEIFQYGVIYIVLKFCSIQIFDDVISDHEYTILQNKRRRWRWMKSKDFL